MKAASAVAAAEGAKTRNAVRMAVVGGTVIALIALLVVVLVAVRRRPHPRLFA